MGDTSGTIEKVTRERIALELHYSSWNLKTYVAGLEADKAALEAELKNWQKMHNDMLEEWWAEREGMVLVPSDVVDMILVAWKLRAEDWGAMKRLEQAQQEQADPAQPQKRAKQENEQ